MDISHDTANRTKMQWILTFVWKYSRRCGILSFIVTIYEEFVNRFGQKKRENVTAVFEKFIEKNSLRVSFFGDVCGLYARICSGSRF